ncbi:hypothetical protein HPOKI673_00970 [Helicobacter pylori oki673]|nr:hypothetical protein HPOKI128_00975 [Helicobacter pylori oki128]AHN42689.1 hypothetical protein HPOKI673_00970 [Helicobacter pylori oki673]AHN44133.1 hypothetical protein HPOKI828_00960 [Helicobacter pylori oki828]
MCLILTNLQPNPLTPKKAAFLRDYPLGSIKLFLDCKNTKAFFIFYDQFQIRTEKRNFK